MRAALRLSLYLWIVLLFSCQTDPRAAIDAKPEPRAFIGELILQELREIETPKQQPVVAVYASSFIDLTGQRRSNSQYADFSTAVTQAPYAYLIRALKHAVERIGLDNITKERQLIRSTRKQFEESTELMPLTFAGLLIEGGVISYETNTKQGGFGSRYLGIGATKEYRQDTVTISLRLVSVSTGAVLLEVLTTKSVLSVAYSQDIFRFIAEGTKLIEIENGVVENESTGIALQTAVETAVLEIIRQGYDNLFWIPRDY